ncbi:hypothetical protein [Emticicia sp. BO119]|uniref:hypothetical protein n=1 Tax=Emticicia sp. BO119 TaxID=2757768 RepID=UPI0015F025F1|nr:hypothetical protein [Emticicia sp. BO119]MBA4849616.1 hypothetical protein [Emticicia sp. BO119]
MKKLALLIILLLVGGTLSAQEKKKKFFVAEKVNYEAKSVKENQENDDELKDEMTNFLGFGFRLSITNMEEKVNDPANKDKKKMGLRFQIGFQMPKFIKTNPPQKLFKAGMDVGIVK